jgi:type IV secretory pathway TraG/TraD family ATPase VirD4
MFAPLVVGLLQEVKDATYRAHGEDDLSHAVLFALDEVANMAPLPDLPQLVSEGAGQGLITMACLQDLSQGRKRWGRQADSFFSLFGMSVILPGIADISTLETLSKLAGTADMVAKSVNRSGGKRGARNGVSYAITQRPRLPSDVIARGYEGHALVLDARKNTSWVALTPVFAHPYWKQFTDPHRAIAMSRSDVGRSR